MSGSDQPIKLVITPVASPTPTSQAAATVPPVTYKVKPGDTLSGIADLFGVSVDDIVRSNNIADPNSLAEGQALTIPGRAPSPTPGSTAMATGTPSPGGTQGSSTSAPTAAIPPTPYLPPPDVTPPQGPTTPPQPPH